MPIGAVAAHEAVTRYAFERSYFRADNTVKPKAFYPDSDGNCSVMVTTGLNDAEIKQVAAMHVTPVRGLPLKGYAVIVCAEIRRAGLEANYEEPPPNPANITAYPEQRERMMELAQLLALAATFTPT